MRDDHVVTVMLPTLYPRPWQSYPCTPLPTFVAAAQAGRVEGEQKDSLRILSNAMFDVLLRFEQNGG